MSRRRRPRTYDEVAAAKTMIERTQRRLALKPNRLAADIAYGTGRFLGWLVDAGITPHIPVWEKGEREDGTFSRSDFSFDKDENVYGRVHDGRTILYRASKRDCDTCLLKPKCCPKVSWRKIPRDVNEEARDLVRLLMGKPEFEKSRNERKRVEMRFAHLKTQHRFERMRLRGLTGACDEFHLVAIAQNLKSSPTIFGARQIRPPGALPKRQLRRVASPQRYGR